MTNWAGHWRSCNPVGRNELAMEAFQRDGISGVMECLGISYDVAKNWILMAQQAKRETDARRDAREDALRIYEVALPMELGGQRIDALDEWMEKHGELFAKASPETAD